MKLFSAKPPPVGDAADPGAGDRLIVLGRGNPQPVGRSTLVMPTEPSDHRFRVLWNGSNIGSHRVAVRPVAGHAASITVTTEIDMQVRLGFITAFRFRHVSEERWADGRLAAIDSRTEDNGDAYTVQGERSPTGLNLVGPAGRTSGAGDLLTTNSLWMRSLTAQTRVVDAQQGDVVALAVVADGSERLGGSAGIEADCFRFETPSWQGRLWYDSSGTWHKAILCRNGKTITLDREG